MFVNKTFRVNHFMTSAAINAKISVLVICVEVIIYLILYSLHTVPLMWLLLILLILYTSRRCLPWLTKFLTSSLQLYHRCFPVNIEKFLRTLILSKICKRLLLPNLRWYFWLTSPSQWRRHDLTKQDFNTNVNKNCHNNDSCY